MKSRILIAVSFVVASFLFFTHPFEGSGDFYHEVNTGKFILANHVLPSGDIWSNTARGGPYIAHSWGTGILYYLFLNHFGPISISLWSALIAFVTLLLLYIVLRARSSTKASLIALGVATVLIATRYPQRPEIIEYPLVLLILLIDIKRFAKPKLAILSLWWYRQKRRSGLRRAWKKPGRF